MITMRYDLLFKNGVKEKVIQSATEAEHIEIIKIVQEVFRDGKEAVITFGNGTTVGRYIRVSDLSQIETEVLEGDEK